MAEPASQLEVTAAEAGQKLLQFLLRRMPLPQPLLHRWIRTGQIRVNGGRAKPFDRLNEGDAVRLPPFAPAMAASAQESAPATSLSAAPPAPPQAAPAHPKGSPQQRITPSTAAAPLPPVVYSDAEIIIFNKPAGLPVHGGTGHTDSLAARIAAHYVHAPFMPTPAHRLDKDTSGLILAAASYRMLRSLQDALRTASLHKEYVAWAEGCWPHTAPHLLRHTLGKTYEGSDERVRVNRHGTTRTAREAACVVHCVRVEPPSPAWPRGRSLLQIRLLTGRTHQIRVQLAAEGFPLCGDAKYGHGGTPLRLHALRLVLPDGCVFVALPPWQGRDTLAEAPAPLEDISAQSSDL